LTAEQSDSGFPDDHAFLEAVTELSVTLRQAENRQALCKILHDQTFPILGDTASELYFHDPAREQFVPAMQPFNYPHEYNTPPVPQVLSFSATVVTSVRETCAPLLINDEDANTADELINTGNKSHLIVPVIDDTAVIAIIYCGRKKTHGFTNADICGVKALAAVVGSRLKNIATIESLRTSMSALEYTERLRTALYEISEQAHSTRSMEELYPSFHQIVGRLVHARNFFIALVEEIENETNIYFPYYIDIHDSRFQGKRLRLNPGESQSLTGYLLESGKPLMTGPDNFEKICQDNGITAIGTRPVSWLGVPFYLEHMSGAVVVQSYDDIVYTEKDKNLLIYVARHLGDALSRKKGIDDLKRAKEQAESAEKNKSAFLANMSHEIRTPMNGIMGMTDLVLNTDITDQQRSHLNMVRSSADRLLTLINDILDFSKIEAGKLEIRSTPFQLRTILADPLSMMALHARQKGLHFTNSTDTDVPNNLIGDPNRLCQVILNLVSNGIKFTEQGTVSLHIFVEKNLKSAQSNEVQLHFSVSDTGIGIPEDQQRAIFEPFSQVDNTKHGSYEGTGLGLVVTAQLVEMMGGSIWVDSSPEEGTCFHFTSVFLTESDAKSGRKRSETGEATLDSKIDDKAFHILLAEDDQINQTVAIALLEREGWQVTAVENGLQVLEHLKNQSFDLIVMDIQMPEMDGYETTRTIREQEKRLGTFTPIIAMTAYAVKGDREKCLDAGMDGYISKPIDSKYLRREIETILSLKQ